MKRRKLDPHLSVDAFIESCRYGPEELATESQLKRAFLSAGGEDTGTVFRRIFDALLERSLTLGRAALHYDRRRKKWIGVGLP